jgi:ATP-dependent Clp endopeptidase proteolytic subunit ClpP
MPFPSEHSARIIDPGKFEKDSFRRKNITSGIDIIMGHLKGESTMTTQSYRFDKDKFTVTEAKKWLKDHDIKYILFEPAKSSAKNMTNFLYTVDVEAEEPIMLINNFIGFDDEKGYGIIGSQFQNELLALDGMEKKRIQVWINSPGGNVTDGYDIYAAILKTKTPVDTICTGMAASIAGVDFQAGRKRIMMDYSFLMYHNPYNEDGSSDKSLDAIRDSLAIMIASRSGKSEDAIRKIMNKTTYISAQEALENGFCDEIQDSGELNMKRKISAPSEAKSYWSECDKIMNSILNPQINNKMTDLQRINNKLGLNPDASEDSTVDAIQAVLDKAEKAEEDKKKAEEDKKKAEEDCTKSEEDLKALKAKLKKAEEDADDLRSKIKKMEEDEEDRKKAKAEEDKKAKAKAEEDAADKAKNLIEDFVKKGRVANKPEVIALWTKNAIADFEGVKNMLESLAPNGKATIIPNTGDSNFKMGSQVANTMGKLYAKAKELESVR